MAGHLAASQTVVERFMREARAVATIRSPHICDVYDVGSLEDGTPFLVLELLEGESLYDAMVRDRQMSAQLTLSIILQLCRGLQLAHAAEIVHRDLKPENVFLTVDVDGNLLVKILDFGVAKVVSHLATLRTTRSLGTPLFMAPEQLTGEGTIDASADLYSLGHVAFCLLAGKPYWYEEAQSASSAYAFVNRVVDVPRENATLRAARFDVQLPPAFDSWFAKATAKKPSVACRCGHRRSAPLSTSSSARSTWALPSASAASSGWNSA